MYVHYAEIVFNALYRMYVDMTQLNDYNVVDFLGTISPVLFYFLANRSRRLCGVTSLNYPLPPLPELPSQLYHEVCGMNRATRACSSLTVHYGCHAI